MRVFLFMLLLLPAPARALEYCEELWFTRNLAFHQAGYCFGSTLGKSIFGNEGCRGKDVSLNAQNAALVARIKAEEAAEGCRVDTSRRSLPIPWIDMRKSFRDLPMPSMFESGCMGWQQRPANLYAARNPASAVTGTIEPGDDLLFEFEDSGPWNFVVVMQDGRRKAIGWTQMNLGRIQCENYAG